MAGRNPDTTVRCAYIVGREHQCKTNIKHPWSHCASHTLATAISYADQLEAGLPAQPLYELGLSELLGVAIFEARAQARTDLEDNAQPFYAA